MTHAIVALPGEEAGHPAALLPADLTSVTIHLDDREQFFWTYLWHDNADEDEGGLLPELAVDIVRDALNLAAAERMADICAVEADWHQPWPDGPWALTLWCGKKRLGLRQGIRIGQDEIGGDRSRFIKARLAQQIGIETIVEQAKGGLSLWAAMDSER